jgi:hypothetical protein
MPRRRSVAVAIACAAMMASACGSGSGGSHGADVAKPKPAAQRVVVASHPVHQLPPGHITLATARTPSGAVAIVLHRIRYFGHASLCVSTTDTQGATNQSCANYPLEPRSKQPIGRAPVWWANADIQLCSRPRSEVVAGVLLRRGLTAWLRTPTGDLRMPHVAIPRAFHVAGPLVYATVTAQPDSVTLRGASGEVTYSAPVAPIDNLPPIRCGSVVTSANGSITRSSSGEIVLVRPSAHVIP